MFKKIKTGFYKFEESDESLGSESGRYYVLGVSSGHGRCCIDGFVHFRRGELVELLSVVTGRDCSLFVVYVFFFLSYMIT